ncbi:MAG TPA: monovalent cation/H+ antiporter subunit D family protein [Desulfurivibrio alkaliphilus]|uniref:Monovalent cation/H+ antiporter subunit D family protein n=1 Tax=Desulfurivibrio alkaliphilus TaxID=427923 RepID=A0A7C2XMI9_9BACT|nr:monovalent cation/H+ antiporter subunit D family protein [Desulfurivibrio alkaliphilus]
MIEQAPALIVIIPLLAALLLIPATPLGPRFAYGLLVTALAATLAAALATLNLVMVANEAVHYRMGDWLPPHGIELVIDHLSGVVLVLVSGCALLTAIYSRQSAEQDNPDRLNQYYALFALLVTGLLGMTATGDVFNLYVLLEISALSSYGLLARGRGPAYYATFKYLVVGTIGACFYLLGVGYIYIMTGSLNMADLAEILSRPELQESMSVKIGFTLIIIGVWIKMALFPLHAWMPNAYSKAGTTTACLVAPLMTKVSIYIMIRLMFSVFSVDYVFGVIPWHHLVSWLAVAAIVVGSLTALAQQDLRKMLAYIIVAEVGYMVGGAWLANEAGLTGAIYHILSDALMTLCLFMAVGAIIYRTGKSSAAAMEGLFAKMPITAAVFVLGWFSIIGIPPTCGFFSKWYLISGGIEAGHWAYVAALLFSSLINAVIFFRLIEIAYFGNFATHDGHHAAPARNEAPFTMLLPMVVTAALLIMVGLYTSEIITALVGKAIPPGL